MLADSSLMEDLNHHAYSTAGDPPYLLRVHLQGPFKNAVLTPQMHAYNDAMSSVRISVEWLFGDIINYLKFLDFKKNLKIGLCTLYSIHLTAKLSYLSIWQPDFQAF